MTTALNGFEVARAALTPEAKVKEPLMSEELTSVWKDIPLASISVWTTISDSVNVIVKAFILTAADITVGRAVLGLKGLQAKDTPLRTGISGLKDVSSAAVVVAVRNTEAPDLANWGMFLISKISSSFNLMKAVVSSEEKVTIPPVSCNLIAGTVKKEGCNVILVTSRLDRTGSENISVRMFRVKSRPKVVDRKGLIVSVIYTSTCLALVSLASPAVILIIASSFLLKFIVTIVPFVDTTPLVRSLLLALLPAVDCIRNPVILIEPKLAGSFNSIINKFDPISNVILMINGGTVSG
jgi:uncharacterized membrane protein